MGTLESRGVVEHGAPRDEPEDPKRPAPWLHFSMASGDLLDDWVTALAVDHGTVYVGTYNAGVTAISLGSNHATQLGGGYVNFGGLLVRDRTLFAATMAGLFARRLGGGEAFRSLPKAAPGRDVTAVVPADRGLWVASRRGLSRFSP